MNVVVENSKRDFPPVERTLIEANIRIAEWRIITPSLENIFISMMSHEQNA
ncbi:MAG: hypothetical protein V1799_05070 [bacterium]